MSKETKIDKYERAEVITKFFDKISIKPDDYDIQELVTIIETIIPVHATIEITNFDTVDSLLALYPLMYQKLSRIYAYFSQQVRIAVGIKDKTYADKMRNYKDAIEQLLKSIKLNYDGLSRRITILEEKR